MTKNNLNDKTPIELLKISAHPHNEITYTSNINGITVNVFVNGESINYLLEYNRPIDINKGDIIKVLISANAGYCLPETGCTEDDTVIKNKCIMKTVSIGDADNSENMACLMKIEREIIYEFEVGEKARTISILTPHLAPKKQMTIIREYGQKEKIDSVFKSFKMSLITSPYEYNGTGYNELGKSIPITVYNNCIDLYLGSIIVGNESIELEEGYRLTKLILHKTTNTIPQEIIIVGEKNSVDQGAIKEINIVDQGAIKEINIVGLNNDYFYEYNATKAVPIKIEVNTCIDTLVFNDGSLIKNPDKDCIICKESESSTSDNVLNINVANISFNSIIAFKSLKIEHKSNVFYDDCIYEPWVINLRKNEKSVIEERPITRKRIYVGDGLKLTFSLSDAFGEVTISKNKIDVCVTKDEEMNNGQTFYAYEIESVSKSDTIDITAKYKYNPIAINYKIIDTITLSDRNFLFMRKASVNFNVERQLTEGNLQELINPDYFLPGDKVTISESYKDRPSSSDLRKPMIGVNIVDDSEKEITAIKVGKNKIEFTVEADRLAVTGIGDKVTTKPIKTIIFVIDEGDPKVIYTLDAKLELTTDLHFSIIKKTVDVDIQKDESIIASLKKFTGIDFTGEKVYLEEVELSFGRHLLPDRHIAIFKYSEDSWIKLTKQEYSIKSKNSNITLMSGFVILNRKSLTYRTKFKSRLVCDAKICITKVYV